MNIRPIAVVWSCALLLLVPCRGFADGDAVAMVNGRPVSKADMVRVLMDMKGLDVLQQFILLEAVRGESQAKNIRVTKDDVEREFQDALERIARDAGVTGDAATPANKMQALETMLGQKQISMAEYRIAIERNAHLRKLVAPTIEINEATMRAEWSRTHGQRRVVRSIIIPTNDERALAEALNQLRNGTDFADVARMLSTDPDSRTRGGELEPFSFDEPNIPPALREQAFLMKPGEISNPLRCDMVYHILKLERILEPENARFEDVRAEVEKDLKSRIIDKKMQDAMKELYDKAKVIVLDQTLKPKYEEFSKQAKDAATKPR